MPLEINFTDLPDDDDAQEEDEYLTEAEQIYWESQLCAPRKSTRRRQTDSGPQPRRTTRALPFAAGPFLARRAAPTISKSRLAAPRLPRKLKSERYPGVQATCYGKILDRSTRVARRFSALSSWSLRQQRSLA